MGEELSMARKEKKGQPVLLAITGSGEPITTSSRRNKRTQESTPPKVGTRGTTEDTETKSKNSRKAKGTDASPSKPKRRGRDYKDRKSDRGNEGENKPARRSSQELAIVHPGSFCDDGEVAAHYWFETERVGNGSLFQCKYCRNYIWLPLFHLDAMRLDEHIRKYGRNEGYCRYLNKHRPAKLIMAKLQNLRRLEAKITDKREFARLADKILNDREYDRKEV